MLPAHRASGHRPPQRTVAPRTGARVLASLLGLGLLAAAFVAAQPPAHADPLVTPNRLGTLHITKLLTPLVDDAPTGALVTPAPGNTPVSGVQFQVRKVTSFNDGDPNTTDTLDLTTEAGWAAATRAADAWTGNVTDFTAAGATISPNNTRPNVSITQTTDAQGVTTFASLPLGLYVVTENIAPAGVVRSAPFLVTIPLTSPTGDGWMYDVYVYPKNDLVSIEKTHDATGSYSLGDQVRYTITATLPEPPTWPPAEVVINDYAATTFDYYAVPDGSRVTVDTDTIEVSVGALGLVRDTDYVLEKIGQSVPNPSYSGRSIWSNFSVRLTSEGIAAITNAGLAGGTIEVTYTASTVAPNPNLGGFDNLAQFQPGDVTAVDRVGSGMFLIDKFLDGQSPANQGTVYLSHSTYAAFALTDDGTVWAWGTGVADVFSFDYSYNQNIAGVPRIIDLSPWIPGTIVQVAGDRGSWLALTSDGKVYSWGQTGDGEWQEEPTQVTALDNEVVVQIARGYYGGSFALTESGVLYSWDSPNKYLLGREIEGDYDSTPAPVDFSAYGNPTIVSFSLMQGGSDEYAFAVDTNGNVYVWAGVYRWLWYPGSHAEIDDCQPDPAQEEIYTAVHPQLVDGSAWVGKRIIQATTVDDVAFALADDGTVYVWTKWPQDGIFIPDSEAYQETSCRPFQAPGLTDITQIATYFYSGKNVLFALSGDGTVYAWGEAYPNTWTEPTALAGAMTGKTIVSITASDGGMYALADDGTLYAVGYQGQTSLGSGLNPVISSEPTPVFRLWGTTPIPELTEVRFAVYPALTGPTCEGLDTSVPGLTMLVPSADGPVGINSGAATTTADDGFLAYQGGNVFTSGELLYGDYCLVEVHAADGYELLADPILITLSDATSWTTTGTGVVTITNYPHNAGFDLPFTGEGGSATWLVGALVLLLALAYLAASRRRAARVRAGA